VQLPENSLPPTRICGVVAPGEIAHLTIMFIRISSLLSLLSLLSLPLSSWAQEFPAEGVEFYQASVKPILAEHCYGCHGGGEPNKAGQVKVKSNFQIISREAVLRGGDHGAAVKLASPEESLLLKVVHYTDEHLKMPPRGKLSGDEIAALEQWVKMGLPVTPEDVNKFAKPAEEAHADKGLDVQWTYEPMKPVTPPAGREHAVDAFLLADLKTKGLNFAPPADKAALIRRATYDLTGLPPKPEEVAAFVADADPQAYEKLLERLLASNHYGEKYGRHWLDLMRFADTNGFERDGFKQHIWRYRQYVLDSFNADKPYDLFLKEQLAGDELDKPTPESYIATGYWRLMQWDDEPADRKQHMFDVFDDNLRVTAETFLGMTIGCARCHNHKADPILQKDYYSFMAFMRGLTNYSNTDCIRDVERPQDPAVVTMARGGKTPRTYPLTLTAERQQAEHRLWEALVKVKEAYHGNAEQRIQRCGETILPTSQEQAVTWDYSETKPADDWAMPGYAPAAAGWKSGPAGFGSRGTANTQHVLRTEWLSGELWLRTYFQLTEIPQNIGLVVYHDDDAEIYLNGKLVKQLAGHVAHYVHLPLELEASDALQTGKNVLAVHVKRAGGGAFIDCGLEYNYEMLRAYALGGGADKLAAELLRPVKGILQQMARQEAKDALESSDVQLAQIALELGKSAPAMHLHIRGNASSEGDEVEPAFPSVFKSPAPKIAPREHTSGRRRALAEWMADPQHPRTSRVMVNRLWQWHFGRGLSASSSDFGKLGAGVSHPALLDWLAQEFVRQGWSLKAMHKLLMSSQAYRQAAVVDQATADAGAAKDPANLLWWRFEPRRLGSEELRDTVLEVSGVLDRRYGGESFFAELPKEVIETASQGASAWKQSEVSERNRRSIYMISKRNLKDPLMTDFDQPDTDNSCPSRFATTVPTQALNLLNSQFMEEQARLLAQRLLKEHPDDFRARAARGLELVTQLPPQPKAVEELLAMEAKFREEFQLAPLQAMERVSVVLLNLNAMVYLD
jgi:hypothetical protein